MEEQKVKNFLYTKGYVCKRLRENGFECKVLPIRYNQNDKRYWSILINMANSEGQNLILTCLKSGIPDKRGVYIVSGSGFNSFKIDTKSSDVLIENIHCLCHPEEVKQ